MAATAEPETQYEYERRLLREDTPTFAQHCLVIEDDEGNERYLEAKPEQLRFDEALEAQRAAGEPMRAIILKARKLGFSTWTQAKLIQRVTQRSNHRALVLGQDTTTAGVLFSMGRKMWDRIPDVDDLRPKDKYNRRQRYLELHNGSIYMADGAKEFEAGRGLTLHSLHLCLAPGTPVIAEDGRVVPVEDLRAGERVVTHNGHAAQVSAITASRPTFANGAGRTVRLRAWMGGAVELTPNHPVFTRRGWVRADKLTLRDEVCMPVRPITEERTEVTFPTLARYDRPGAGKTSVANGATVSLTEEFGFALGYYLAEGSIVHNSGRRPAGLCFSRHREETAFADRAVAGLEGLVTSRRTSDRIGTLTTSEVVYGAALAAFVKCEFGATNEKRIPDWVFQAGPGFARGIVAGYLSGDGSKVATMSGEYQTPIMSATTICGSLATQIRDLVAGLGLGWGTIDYDAKRRRYERATRPVWTARWGGRAARELRRLVGLDVPESGRDWVQRYELDGDKVWMRLRQIEEGETEWVYDVEVDHEDHSFRTLHFAVKNSEVAFYDDAQRKLRGLINAVPKTHPNTMIVLESTANGQNYFKELWDAARAGESDYIPFFSPWFHDPFYRRVFANEAERHDFLEHIGEGTIGEDEPDLIDLMAGEKMGLREIHERLHWRRWVLRGVDFNNDVEKFHVEYPSTAEEAFLATGRYVFDARQVQKMKARVRELGPPVTGTIDSVGPERSRQSRGVIVQIPTAVRFKAAPINDDRSPGWRIWEHPQRKTDDIPAGQYVIGGDASGGDEKEGTSAYHVLSVCDHRTRRQVAEYRSKIDPDELALEAYKACLYWNMAWVAIEVTGSWGGPAMRRLARDFHYPFVYQRQRLDSRSEKWEDRLGWHTGFAEKKLLLSELKEMLRNGEDGTLSRGLADEYGWYILDDRNRAKPEFGKTSDRLMARGIAVCVAREKPLRPERKRGEVHSTIDGVTIGRTGYRVG